VNELFRVRRPRLRRFLLVAGAVAALLAAAAWELVLSRGRTPPIVGPDGAPLAQSVASLEQVSLGGVPQWILVRGRDRRKPVLLFAHGGPGMPAMHLAHAWQRPLEEDFVIVHWDRRGVGKSSRSPLPEGSLTVRRTLDDLHELTDLLRARFGQERIYLLGHSWGSYLGLLEVHERPDRYLALIGTGQEAGTRAEIRAARRAFFAAHAARTHDDALARRLADPASELGEDDLFRYGGELYGARSVLPLIWAGLRAPEYDLADMLALKRSCDRVNHEMREDVEPKLDQGEIRQLEIPVFLLLGRHDENTPSELAVAYLDRLQAPLKGVEWLDRSAHLPFFEEPERFRAALQQVDAAVQRFWKSPPVPGPSGNEPQPTR